MRRTGSRVPGLQRYGARRGDPARGGGQCRGVHRRTDRRLIHRRGHAARRLFPHHPRDLRPASGALHCRRSAHRRRTHRHLERPRSLRRHARHHDTGQGDLRRLCAALGGDRARADPGRARARIGRPHARADLLAPSGHVRRRRRDGAVSARAPPRGALRGDVPGAARRAAVAARAAARGRRARPRAARRRRVRARPRDARTFPARREVRRDVRRLCARRRTHRVAERRARRRRARRPRDDRAALRDHGRGDPRDRDAVRDGARRHARANPHREVRMTAAAQPSKITYTSTNVDLDAFHRAFDEAVARVRGMAGKHYPLYVGGRALPSTAEQLTDTSPIDRTLVLGTFDTARAAEVDVAVTAARGAQRAWERLGWTGRVKLLRRAAAIIRERKFDLAAVMALEVGKSRLESMGDAEESADLIDYYCGLMEDAAGFRREMARMTPIETNIDVLRAYGVFACIAPFNFPLALSAGMSAAALVSGNTVVYKPAEDTPWTGQKLYEVYRDAGLPAGVFNLVHGRGAIMGDALWRHPGVDGVVFTGSKAVGMRIYHE